MRKKDSSGKTETRKATMPKATVYCFLAVIVIVNILYRYPVSASHEMGSDTTFVHSLATSISSEGYAKWCINPLSFFGLYALSYPSATPFLLSALSQLSGISVEGLILLLGMVFGILGSLSAYLVAREIMTDDRFALVVAALFSLAPFFLKDTSWVGSSRGYVVAALPILVALLIKHLKARRFVFLAIAIVLFLFLTSLHRMGFLSIFLFIAFAFIPSFHRLTQRIRFSLVRYESFFRVFSLFFALFGFLLIFLIQIAVPGYGGFDIREEYRTGTFFEGDAPAILLVNMGVNFTGKVGLLMPLTLVGLVLYSWKRPKNIRDKFALLLIFILFPFLSLRDYISEFMILFFVLLIVFALLRMASRISRKSLVAVSIVLAVLVSSLGFSWVMKDYWRNRYATDSQIREDEYDTSIYISHYGQGVVLSNAGLLGGRVMAVSGVPTLPLGGASTHWHSPQQLIFGTYQSENLIFMPVSSMQTRRLNIDEITFNTDEIFVPTNVRNALRDWETILYNHMNTGPVQDLLDRYGVLYALVDKGIPNGFISYNFRDSLFLPDVYLQEYKLYENTGQMIWFLGNHMTG